MGSVTQAFVALAAVIGVGVLLAHARMLNLNAQAVLARIAFYVASPALMVTVLSEAERRPDVLHRPGGLGRGAGHD